MYVMLYKFYN